MVGGGGDGGTGRARGRDTGARGDWTEAEAPRCATDAVLLGGDAAGPWRWRRAGGGPAVVKAPRDQPVERARDHAVPPRHEVSFARAASACRAGSCCTTAPQPQEAHIGLSIQFPEHGERWRLRRWRRRRRRRWRRRRRVFSRSPGLRFRIGAARAAALLLVVVLLPLACWLSCSVPKAGGASAALECRRHETERAGFRLAWAGTAAAHRLESTRRLRARQSGSTSSAERHAQYQPREVSNAHTPAPAAQA